LQTVRFKPKAKGEVRKAFNTVYVKDVPARYDTKEGVSELFKNCGADINVWQN
jgi:hypothetical protein